MSSVSLGRRKAIAVVKFVSPSLEANAKLHSEINVVFYEHSCPTINTITIGYDIILLYTTNSASFYTNKNVIKEKIHVNIFCLLVEFSLS